VLQKTIQDCKGPFILLYTIYYILYKIYHNFTKSGDQDNEQPNTDQDDRSRVIEMLKDLNNSTLWAATNRVLDREELDRSGEDRLQPFEEPAERFNDPIGYPYTNALLDANDVPNTSKFGDISDSPAVHFDPATVARPRRDGGGIQKTLPPGLQRSVHQELQQLYQIR
jgi:hypothetical protein